MPKLPQRVDSGVNGALVGTLFYRPHLDDGEDSVSSQQLERRKVQEERELNRTSVCIKAFKVIEQL